MPGSPDLRQETALLARLRSKEADLDRLDSAAREALYREIRTAARQAAFKNPLLAGRPIVFLKQRRFICQMLHEYLGYYYNYGDLAGGDVCVLEEPGRSFKVRGLTEGRMPRGAYTTLSLSYDAKTAYFAFAEVRNAERPRGRFSDWTKLQPAHEVGEEFNYFSPNRSCFHLFAVGVDGRNLRQLTHSADDDFDPARCPMAVSPSCRRGGADSAAVTMSGNRCPPTRSTASTRGQTRRAVCRRMKPTSGILRCSTTAVSSIRVGTTSIARRHTITACG